MNKENCMLKQRSVRHAFAGCVTPEAIYHKIIAFGKKLPPMSPEHMTPQNLVKGCQSRLYLHSECRDGKIYFTAHSEALISKGLAALLVAAYSGLSPTELVKYPPHFLKVIGVHGSLTPSRSNGLASLHLRMKQDALKCIMAQKECTEAI